MVLLDYCGKTIACPATMTYWPDFVQYAHPDSDVRFTPTATAPVVEQNPTLRWNTVDPAKIPKKQFNHVLQIVLRCAISALFLLR